MEYKIQPAENSELQFTPTESENLVLREAIRKQLLAAATGRVILHHDAATTLIHYLDVIGNDQSQIQTVCCRRQHLEVFIDALRSAMRDFSSDDMAAADLMVRDFRDASIETETSIASTTLPDYVPDNL